ncbi:MAG TPA: hypothetical protein VD929_00090 [Caulobacteraceae bacterium]|nr:hypothetical protein [Caulobacteraceae bacterium]
MEPIITAFLAVHIVSGTGALFCGALPIFAPKRKGFHTRWGKCFAACMWGVLGSAIVLTLISRNAYFAALTTSATLGCFSGLRALRRKRPDVRQDDRATGLDWAVTIAALGVALLLAGLQVQGHVKGTPAVVWSLLAGAFVVGGYDLLRFAFPAAWPFFPRLWFYEHLVKILTSYAAVLSAFSGSIAFRFLPDPWKQLWAPIAVQILILGMILWYARQNRRRASAAAGG